MNQSVAIIGGGIIGMSIAWRLAERGRQVAVFDIGSIGGEASWVGAGMLAPGGEIERATPLAGAAVEGRAIYARFVRELEQASGTTIDYQECGGLDLAYGVHEWEELQSRAARQAALGIESKPVEVSRVAAFWPRVRTEGLTGAFFFPNDAIVNPRDIMSALAAACGRLGVALHERDPVTEVEVSNNDVKVITGQGTHIYGAAIIAAGAWSSEINIRGLPELPNVEPVKGHLIGYRQPEQTCPTIVRHGHTYLLQRANGLLIAGASLERVGFDRKVRPQIVSSLAAEAGFVLPHLVEAEPTEAWIGFRPYSDALQIGSWHSDRLFLAYGHFRNGILLAPWTAERIVNTFAHE